MRVSELKSLMIKVKDHIETTKLMQHEQNLINTLTQNTRPNAGKSPLDPHLTNFTKAVSSFEFNLLSNEETQFANIYRIDGILGKDAESRIMEILRDERIDPAGVVQKISEHHRSLDALQKTSIALIENLKEYSSGKDISLSKEEGKLQVHFTNQTKIDNITDFYHWIHTWNNILRGFTVASDLRPETITITYVQKSSPLIMELGVLFGVLNLIGGATLLILKNIDRYLDIRLKKKQIAETDGLTSRDEIVKLLETELERFEKNASDRIARELLQKLNKDPEEQNEAFETLKVGLGALFDFLNKGGQVELGRLPEAENADESNTLIAESQLAFEEIRKLQSEVEDEMKLLDSKASQEGPESQPDLNDVT